MRNLLIFKTLLTLFYSNFLWAKDYTLKEVENNLAKIKLRGKSVKAYEIIFAKNGAYYKYLEKGEVEIYVYDSPEKLDKGKKELLSYLGELENNIFTYENILFLVICEAEEVNAQKKILLDAVKNE